MTITIQPKGDWNSSTLNEEGLDLLANIKQLVVKQHLSTVEAVTGWDKTNKYHIWNGQTGKQVLKAREDSISCCIRNYCGQLREFSMPFLDDKDREIFRLEKTRSCANVGLYGCCASCCAKCCGGCGFSDSLTNLIVKIGESSEFYVIQGQTGIGCCQDPLFSVIDMKTNELIYTVTYGSCCTAAWRCDDVTYEINTPKGDAIGTMTKHWGGGSGGAFACCSEMFNASTHVLDFPKDATPRQKAALVGATLLIDFAYYQYSNDG